jgi:molybdopterin-guanine dinucleotide biosynthesis protein A
MTAQVADVAGAVLTGGSSRRMGTDKAQVHVDGRPMAMRVADALAAGGAVRVITVGGAPRGWGLDHVADRYPGQGPLGGVITALSALVQPWVVIAACDLAWLDAATVRALVDRRGQADVVVARTDRREPLCALWSRQGCLGALEAVFAAGERAMGRSWADLSVTELMVASRALTNVNTPEDLVGGPGVAERAGRRGSH